MFFSIQLNVAFHSFHCPLSFSLGIFFLWKHTLDMTVGQCKLVYLGARSADPRAPKQVLPVPHMRTAVSAEDEPPPSPPSVASLKFNAANARNITPSTRRPLWTHTDPRHKRELCQMVRQNFSLRKPRRMSSALPTDVHD